MKKSLLIVSAFSLALNIGCKKENPIEPSKANDQVTTSSISLDTNQIHSKSLEKKLFEEKLFIEEHLFKSRKYILEKYNQKIQTLKNNPSPTFVTIEKLINTIEEKEKFEKYVGKINDRQEKETDKIIAIHKNHIYYPNK